jgi:hypothetical protein
LRFIKDDDAKLDFAIDWSEWLDGDGGEVIVSYQVRADEGITVVSHSELDGVVTIWLSGGEVRRSYSIGCLINTNSFRIDERTFTVWVKER